jgi:hypothetical protein
MSRDDRLIVCFLERGEALVLFRGRNLRQWLVAQGRKRNVTVWVEINGSRTENCKRMYCLMNRHHGSKKARRIKIRTVKATLIVKTEGMATAPQRCMVDAGSEGGEQVSDAVRGFCGSRWRRGLQGQEA